MFVSTKNNALYNGFVERKWFATDFPKKPLQRQKNRMNAGSKDQQTESVP